LFSFVTYRITAANITENKKGSKIYVSITKSKSLEGKIGTNSTTTVVQYMHLLTFDLKLKANLNSVA
jgi:hypothetical protein